MRTAGVGNQQQYAGGVSRSKSLASAKGQAQAQWQEFYSSPWVSSPTCVWFYDETYGFAANAVERSAPGAAPGRGSGGSAHRNLLDMPPHWLHADMGRGGHARRLPAHPWRQPPWRAAEGALIGRCRHGPPRARRHGRWPPTEPFAAAPSPSADQGAVGPTARREPRAAAAQAQWRTISRPTTCSLY